MSFTTKAVATASVTTSAANSIKATSATLSGSYSGASGTVTEVGFYWGTSAGNLNNEFYVDSGSGASGSFSESLTSLTESTTYYFKAYILEYNEDTGSYEYRYGSVRSFTTSAAAAMSRGYLDCYEVPALTNLSGSGTSGNNSGRDDNWFRYYTNNANQQVATHTFTHPTTSEQTRNYTVLYDGSKYAPVWVAYAMHSTTWEKILSGRNGSWGTDPAISLTQQTGLDNAEGVGYSRGHMVSSQERQTTEKQNNQTFYYTNQAPQWQNGFNSGVWSTMEADIVSHAPSGRDTLYVVTGVLYEGTTSTLPSGSGAINVPIPSHFYKCLMKCTFNASGDMTAASGCAYIFTNESHSGESYSDGITTIDAVEARAGFDFFPNVPSALQTTAEGQSAGLW